MKEREKNNRNLSFLISLSRERCCVCLSPKSVHFWCAYTQTHTHTQVNRMFTFSSYSCISMCKSTLNKAKTKAKLQTSTDTSNFSTSMNRPGKKHFQWFNSNNNEPEETAINELVAPSKLLLWARERSSFFSSKPFLFVCQFMEAWHRFHGAHCLFSFRTT